MLDATKRRLRPGHQLVDEGAGTPSRRRLAALRDRGRMDGSEVITWVASRTPTNDLAMLVSGCSGT
jgi:hypothetical protein